MGAPPSNPAAGETSTAPGETSYDYNFSCCSSSCLSVQQLQDKDEGGGDELGLEPQCCHRQWLQHYKGWVLNRRQPPVHHSHNCWQRTPQGRHGGFGTPGHLCWELSTGPAWHPGNLTASEGRCCSRLG